MPAAKRAHGFSFQLARTITMTLVTATAAVSPLAAAQSAPLAIAPQTSIAVKEDTEIAPEDYRIGAEDLLEITVFEAPEFNSTSRVSPSGQVSIPMLGVVPAAGKTPAQLQMAVQDSLRSTHMRDPHVGVAVKEIQSHAVSVLGAVRKPGTLQIRNPKTLLEILSMAEGLADDSGDTVWVRHQGEGLPAGLTSARAESDFGGDAGATEEIDLKDLLEFSTPAANVLIRPGDIVNVSHAGIIYVVGEVRKPGGFVLKRSETVTALQALALAEGFTRTSSRSQARIIRTEEATGARREILIDLKKVLAGKLADVPLQPKDVLLVPNSAGRSALYRGLEAAVSVGTGLAIYRR